MITKKINELKMNFSERLKELRVEKNLSKKELTDSLHIKYSTYSNYESGIREPGSDFLLLISNFYNVSIDYILGLSDTKYKTKDLTNISDAENKLINKYRTLSSQSQKLVDTIIDFELNRINE